MQDFNWIYDEYADAVYNHCWRMLNNAQDAEEAAQDTFLNIYRNLENYRGDSKLSTWIYRITANVCLSRLRKKKLPSDSLDDVQDQGVQFADDTPQPDRIMEESELREQLGRLMQKLAPQYRQVVTFFYFQGLSYDEIADITGVPSGTIGSAIHRAKTQLKNLLVKEMA